MDGYAHRSANQINRADDNDFLGVTRRSGAPKKILILLAVYTWVDKLECYRTTFVSGTYRTRYKNVIPT